MIERTLDAEFFNRICNLPEVRPWVAPIEFGELDLTALISNPLNYALRTEHGGFILQAHGAGFYSVHTQFAAEGRGAHAIEAMRAGLDFMFTRTDCMQIHSHCPDTNPAALALATKGGARPWFRKEHDPLGSGQVVRWEVLDWAVSEPELEFDGNAFHEMLEDAKAEKGSVLPTHADDPWHDRMVGAVSRMARRGNVRKGVALYNIWAAASGYAPISLISDTPPTVDVGDGIVALNQAGDMEVLLCR
jgi:RimJ/RimL family protein N-acetyltransferase